MRRHRGRAVSFLIALGMAFLSSCGARNLCADMRRVRVRDDSPNASDASRLMFLESLSGTIQPPLQLDLHARTKLDKVSGVSVGGDRCIRDCLGERLTDLAMPTVKLLSLPEHYSRLVPSVSLSPRWPHSILWSRELTLDEDVNRKLIDWKIPENEFTKNQKVTLRRLLSHSAEQTSKADLPVTTWMTPSPL